MQAIYTRTSPLTNPSSWTIECHYASIHRESSLPMISHEKKFVSVDAACVRSLGCLPLLPRGANFTIERRGRRGGRFAGFIYCGTHTHTHVHCAVSNRFFACIENYFLQNRHMLPGDFALIARTRVALIADRSIPKFTQCKTLLSQIIAADQGW